MTEPSAIVFNIERFALRDGPGIRTAVFLKGCPLRCLWCHSPESQAFQPELLFDAGKCTRCRACEKNCAAHAVWFDSAGRRAFDRARCRACGKCAESCSAHALELAGREYTVSEVLKEVRRDRLFYSQSNGGLTLSGGEPLAHIEFTAALLAAAKAEGISTAVETGGFAARADFERILPVTDLFLFDIKSINDSRHRLFTGVSNAAILANLRFLAGSHAQIILRCPLIPGLNDAEEDLDAIAALTSELAPAVRRIDLEPYHPLGLSKYRRLGIAPPFESAAFTPGENVRKWIEYLSARISVPVAEA